MIQLYRSTFTTKNKLILTKIDRSIFANYLFIT